MRARQLLTWGVCVAIAAGLGAVPAAADRGWMDGPCMVLNPSTGAATFCVNVNPAQNCAGKLTLAVVGPAGYAETAGVGCGGNFSFCTATATDPIGGGLFYGQCEETTAGLAPLQCFLPAGNPPAGSGWAMTCG